MNEVIIDSLVKETVSGNEYKVIKKMGSLYLLKPVKDGNTLRRTAKLIIEQFTTLENPLIKVEAKVAIPEKPKRVARENLDIKRAKKTLVDIHAVELKALQFLQQDVVETEDIVELTFDSEIGTKLRVPFQVLKMLPTTGRVNYMVQKLDSDDEWTKLLYYIWCNRKDLRKYTRFPNIEEIALSLLGKGDRPKELNFIRVKKELEKVLSYSRKTGLIDYESFTNVVTALPDGHNSELSYYLYAITTDLFKTSEWGAVGLDSTLIAQIESETVSKVK